MTTRADLHRQLRDLRRVVEHYGPADWSEDGEALLAGELERHHEPADPVCAGIGCSGCRWTGHARERA